MKPCRVVRTDGTVEHDWAVAYPSYGDIAGVSRVIVVKVEGDTIQKVPTIELFECWQNGGMCRSTAEHNALCGTKDTE